MIIIQTRQICVNTGSITVYIVRMWFVQMVPGREFSLTAAGRYQFKTPHCLCFTAKLIDRWKLGVHHMDCFQLIPITDNYQHLTANNNN